MININVQITEYQQFKITRMKLMEFKVSWNV